MLDRPPIVMYEGWYEFIVVHDLWYLQEKRRRRNQLLRWHPDLGRGPSNFKEAIRSYRAWLQSERLYYAMRRMRPPDDLGSGDVERPRLGGLAARYPCGTVKRYWQGCRCGLCRDADRAYRPRKTARMATRFACGTINRYWQGCRCPPCSAEQRKRDRKRQRKRRAQ